MPRKREKYITECIKVQKLIPGGQALGELASGKKVFLWGVLPGRSEERRVGKECL